MAYENSWPRRLGFLATAINSAANTMPIPIPAPPSPMAAEPMPKFCETCTRALAISEEYARRAPWATRGAARLAEERRGEARVMVLKAVGLEARVAAVG